MKKYTLALTVITILSLFDTQSANARLNSSVQRDSTVIAPDSVLQRMTDDELSAYFDSLYRAEHPKLDTVCNDNNGKPGNRPNRQPASFPYSNSYVPNTFSANTSKAVGQIEVLSGVSPTGAKTYTIPILSYQHDDVFGPDICLSYNSQRGKSHVGKGWLIGGIQCITRGSKSMHYDGQPGGVRMKPDDAFYLEGMRLIRTSTSAYEYQTEQGNIKVIATVSGDLTKSFTVFYPNGQKATFGNAETTYNHLQYPITKLTDERGRSIQFSYSESGYTCHVTQITYDHSKASIQFNYDDTHADYDYGYLGGLNVRDTKLLKSIVCKYDGENLGVYSLTYVTNEGVSLLSQVSYNVNSSMLNPLKFYYGSGSAEAAYDVESKNYISGYNYTNRNMVKYVRGRFDYGSGAEALFVLPAELPYYHVYNGGTSNYFQNKYDADQTIYAYSHLDEDMAGTLPSLKTEEGFVELLCADLKGNQTEYLIRVNNVVIGSYDRVIFNVFAPNALSGITLYKSKTFDFSTLFTDGAGHKSVQPKFYYAGDFNGDGKMEILAVSAENPLGETTRPSKCYIFDLINGTKLYEGHLFSFHKEFLPVAGSTDPEDNSDKLLAIDVNGDGKTELCHISSSGTTVYSFSSTNGVWTASTMCNNTTPKLTTFYKSYWSCGDFNGDGLTDIICSPSRGLSSSNWSLLLSKGDGSFAAESVQCASMSTSSGSDFLTHDVDGDGISDLLELTAYQMRTYIIRNNTATLKATNNLPSSNIFLASVNINSSTLSCQLVGVQGYNASLMVYKTKQLVEHSLTGLVNSLGVIDKNYYYSIGRDSYGIYSCGSGASFPYANLYPGMPVLAGSEVFLNGESKDINKYYYGNAVLHRQGLGFRGFETVRMKNKRGQMHTTTYEPYNYSVVKLVDTPENTVTYSNSVTVASNKTVKAQPVSKTEYDKLRDITATTAYTYDAYGQVLTANSTLPGNITVNKTFTYFNYTDISSKYHLGLPKTMTTTTKRGSSQHSVSTSITSYNAADQPLTIVEKINGNAVKTTTLVYNSDGQITSRTEKPYTSSKTKTWNYTYTARRLTMMKEPAGTTETYSYNNNGTVSKITTYAGDTEYTYDVFGRETKHVNPDNTVIKTAFSWDSGNGGIYGRSQPASASRVQI